MKKTLLSLALVAALSACKKEECEPTPPVTVVEAAPELTAKYTVWTYGDPLVEITRNGHAVEPDSGTVNPYLSFTVLAASGDQMAFRFESAGAWASAQVSEESYPNGDWLTVFADLQDLSDTTVSRVAP